VAAQLMGSPLGADTRKSLDNDRVRAECLPIGRMPDLLHSTGSASRPLALFLGLAGLVTRRRKSAQGRQHWECLWPCFSSLVWCKKGHPMEGMAVGFFFLLYGIIAGVLASGSTLLTSTLVMLVSRWWPPLVRVQCWQALIATFFVSLILIFRALVSCGLVVCLL